MQERYGFVYIWYDVKKKRFYIGCHWGYEGDGYICSSSNMKKAYKRRPEDFKGPRILKKVYTNKKDLLEEEYYWLSMIKKEELGRRYYNLHNHHYGHWSSDEYKAQKVRKKISTNYPKRPEVKEKISNTLKEYFSNDENRKRNKKKQKELYSTPEMKAKMSEVRKKQWANPEFRAKMLIRLQGSNHPRKSVIL